VTKRFLRWEEVLAAEYRALYGEAPLTGPTPADRDAHLRAIVDRIHERGPAAVCLSGGGIRSATFGLGVLQGLAHVGVLGSIDYLSTVSGGGYIGGWLTAWLHREGKTGRNDVLATLDPAQGQREAPCGEASDDTSPSNACAAPAATWRRAAASSQPTCGRSS
jgi:hypothetical protein